jgi:hypothetical protein
MIPEVNLPMARQRCGGFSWQRLIFASPAVAHATLPAVRGICRRGACPYGKQILATVSQELTAEFGAAFTYTALTRTARFAEWTAVRRLS